MVMCIMYQNLLYETVYFLCLGTQDVYAGEAWDSRTKLWKTTKLFRHDGEKGQKAENSMNGRLFFLAGKSQDSLAEVCIQEITLFQVRKVAIILFLS